MIVVLSVGVGTAVSLGISHIETPSSSNIAICLSNSIFCLNNQTNRSSIQNGIDAYVMDQQRDSNVCLRALDIIPDDDSIKVIFIAMRGMKYTDLRVYRI